MKANILVATTVQSDLRDNALMAEHFKQLGEP